MLLITFDTAETKPVLSVAEIYKIMKVFKITVDENYYGIYAENKTEALAYLIDEIGFFENETVEEISESEWNKRTINIWEDNDFSKKPYKTSIRENICGKETQMLFTNNFSTFN